MIPKRPLALFLTFVLLLAPVLEYRAEPRVVPVTPGVQRIDAVDASGTGVFQLVLDKPPETMSRALLVYELTGVPHWTAAVRSINGLPALGGFGAVPSSGTALQVEEINPRWLRTGLNQIVFFPAPAGEPAPSRLRDLPRPDVFVERPAAAIPYTVRNLRLVYMDGPAEATPYLRLSHPTDGEGDGDGMVVRGFADPPGMPAGPAELFVNESYIQNGISQVDGSFSVYVPRTALAGEPWEVRVEVVYPDGSRLRRNVRFTGEDAGDESGDTDEGAELDADPESAESLGLGEARLDITPGALPRKVRLTMRALRGEELPAMDAGMTNVTPQRRGFRLGPHGLRFHKPVELRLPYDATLIPNGMTADDVRTFYFDEEAGRWMPIQRVGAEAGSAAAKGRGPVIVSATDHFTDFVNATLAMPEEPSGANFEPDSLQELAKGDPAAGIVQIAPPEGGATGSAMLEFPLVVPPGRHGMQPELAVRYDSSGDNGWLGVGWDLHVPRIEISTAFGVPRYDGTERYLIDGEQLVPSGTANVFVRRVEGSFDRIVRKGNDATGYSWEVTDKDGTRYLYGTSAQSRLRDPQARKIFRWYLERQVDLHGNSVDYTYVTDQGGGGTAGEPWTAVYPARIDYTAGTGIAPYYHVTFTLESGRTDRLSSGRQGFKTYLRQRLARVDVLAGTETVRQYVFDYREGDFRKSLLAAIVVRGERGSPEFYRHTFDYAAMPVADSGDGYDGFSAEQEWDGIASGADFTASQRIGGGGHGFAGLGPPGCQPHAGIQVGGSGTDTTQSISFVDVNGDGLPDRLDDDGNVDLNGFDPATNGAGPGAFSSAEFGHSGAVGHTSEWSLDLGAGVHAEAGITASLDASWVWSHANDDRLIADVNGDYRPDLVTTSNGFKVFLNDGRAFVSASGGWDGFTAQGLSLSSAGEESEVMSSFTRADPLRQLVLPWSGQVTLSGAVQKKAAGGDGADASIYLNGARVWTRRFAANDVAPCIPGPGNSCAGGLSFPVAAGDSLYFLAGSIRDTELDALQWSPAVSYDGQDQQALEPYGAKRFVFDAAADFSLAGYRGASWSAPAAGTIRVTGPLVKFETSDDVTLTVLLIKAGVTVPVFARTFAAAEQASFEQIPAIAVESGNRLHLTLSSATPVDPRRIHWTPSVRYEGATVPATLPDDARTAPAQVAIALPSLKATEPTRSWPVTTTGEQTFQLACALTGPATFYVQGVNRLLKAVPLLKGPASFEVKVAATAGEPLFLTLVNEGPTGSCAANKGAVPVNTRWRTGPSSNVLSGGHHGWYYGEWNGNVPFTPAGLVAPDDEDDDADFVAGTPHWEVTAGSARPAWTGAGFDGYVAADGLKPSRKGANAAGVLDASSGVSSGGGLSVLRKTSSRTAGIAASAGVGLSLSQGTSETQLDLLDMNGDHYPDQVSGSGVRFSNGKNGFAGLQGFPGLGPNVRASEDGNVSLSVGIGINFTKKNGKGKSTAVLSTLPSVGSTVALTQTKYDLIDVNGDGLPDRVSMSPGSGAVTVQLNLGYRFGLPESWSLPALASSSSHCNDAVDYASSAIGSISPLDTLNGLSFTRSSALNAGLAIGPFGGTVSTTLSRTLVELLDINGDGLPDRVVKDQQGRNAGYFRVQLNLGDHWDAEQRWYAPDWTTSIGDGYNPSVFQCLDAVSFSGHVEVQGSAGFPICIPLVPPVPVVGLQIEVSVQAFGSTSSGLQLFLEDLDGDGLADHILKKAGDATVYVKRNQAAGVNLLKSVRRPLGSTIDLSYERRGNHTAMPFSQWVLSTVSVNDGRGSAPYVTRYAYDDDAFYDRAERENYGFGHVRITLPDRSTIDREYLNGDLHRRHLLAKEVLADANGNVFRVQTATYDSLPVDGAGASRFPALAAEHTFFYEGTTTTAAATAPKSTRKTYRYDNLGNVTETVDFADAGTADDVTATISWQFDATTRVARPASIEVRDGTGRLLRGRQGTYDQAGELTRLEQVLTGGRDPATGFTYTGSKNAVQTFVRDGFGNITSSTDPAGFTTTFTYDPATRTHPVEVRDSFGYTTRYGYDLKYGVLAQTTDENGQTMRRTYDGFGRIARVIGPYDSDAAPALSFEYGPGAPVSWAVVRHKDSTRSDTIDSATFIDSLERVLQTKEDAELDLGSGTSTRTGMRVSGRVSFDAKGRLASQGQPLFDDSPANRFVNTAEKKPTTFTYDVADRIRTVRYPDGATTKVDYGFAPLDGTTRFLTVRTDAAGRATRFYRDVNDQVVGVEQTNTIGGARKKLITRYTFDALDQLIEVTDAKGNKTRLEYDTLGRNVILDNPDLGRTEQRFDPAGNLGAKITANLAARGQQVRYLYTFNRLDKIDYPVSPDVVYTWGGPNAPLNRANRIATVTDASGFEERSYGKLGEVVQITKTTAALNGTTPKGPYTTRFQFDGFERLLSVVYPDGETLTYGYDAGGEVKSASGLLKGVRFDYLRHLGYDEFGERARMVLGNGVETRFTYDPSSRLLAQLRTTAAGRDLQNLRYQYDLSGTLQSLQNDVPVPAASLYGGPTTQTFQYDELVQLVGAQGTYRNAPNKASTYTLALRYDELGNITSKNQLHHTGGAKLNVEKKTTYNWAYAYAGRQPHAATSIGERTFRYDADGNQTGWDSSANGTRRTLTWDEDDHLASVADNGQTTRFLYDAEGTRTNKAGPHGETTYVNRWFSIRNGAIASKHVFAGDVRLATKVSPDPNPPSEKVYFFQADHLGSSQFVTDELGTVYQHLEYFPSGEVWVDERSETQRTPYLFSGKELDEETGLSYFGHRYHDARQGQWISSDPILDEMLEPPQHADVSRGPFHLSGSMTGYVGNDPMNFVDPDGLTKFKALTTTASASASASKPKTKRMQYVGSTPGKHSATGKMVQLRMKMRGRLKGNMVRVALPDGSTGWQKLDKDIHMGHLVDAVRLWNGLGKFFGKKHKVVRAIMLDANNYVLENGSVNMSKGATLGATTRYDDPEATTYDSVRGTAAFGAWKAALHAAKNQYLDAFEWAALSRHVPAEAR